MIVKKPLWTPTEDRMKNANITRFMTAVNQKYGKQFKTYDDLYQWSVENIADFWAAMWEFAEIKASRPYDRVIDDPKKMPGAKWFPGAKLNFAENLLRYRDDRLAFIFKGETQKSARMTYAELFTTVARLAKSLRELGRGICQT
jgi:acetoacetyl-CoA synthetase